MDIKRKLVTELKKEGLDIVEVSVYKFVKVAFSVIIEILEESKNQWYKLLIPVIQFIVPKVYKIIDKINKEQDLDILG